MSHEKSRGLAVNRAVPRWLSVWAVAGGLLLTYAIFLVVVYDEFHFGTFLIALMALVFIGLWSVVRARGWLVFNAWLHKRRFRLWVWRLALVGFLLWLASVAVFFVFMHHDRTISIDKIDTDGRQAILILGSGVPRCRVSLVLQSRLDKGIELAQRWPNAIVIVTGGKNPWLDCTEGQVMGDYLRTHGVKTERIVQEERSTSTYENLQFSSEVLQQLGFDKSHDMLIIVTNEFHALRARWIAEKQDFKRVISENAATPLYARFAIWLREYFAYVNEYLSK